MEMKVHYFIDSQKKKKDMKRRHGGPWVGCRLHADPQSLLPVVGDNRGLGRVNGQISNQPWGWAELGRYLRDW